MTKFFLICSLLLSSFSMAVDFQEKHSLTANFDADEAKVLANAFGLYDTLRGGKQVILQGLQLDFYVMGSAGGNGVATYRYSGKLSADLTKLQFEKKNSSVWLLPTEVDSKDIYEKLKVMEMDVTHFENGEGIPVKQKDVSVGGVKLICQYSTEITPQYFCSLYLAQ